MVETGVPGLEQTGWDALRGQLNTLDTSLLFLALLTGATALSWAILSLFSAVPGDSLHRSIPGGGSLCLGRAQCPCLPAGAGGCSDPAV